MPPQPIMTNRTGCVPLLMAIPFSSRAFGDGATN
jgi:hypothetical protein